MVLRHGTASGHGKVVEILANVMVLLYRLTQSPQQKPDPVIQEEAQVAQAPQNVALPRVLLLAVLDALPRAEDD